MWTLLLVSILFLVPGALAYTGRWRAWVRGSRGRPTLFGVFWMGVGLFVTGLAKVIGQNALGAILLVIGFAVFVAGVVFVRAMPARLLPRWFRPRRRAPWTGLRPPIR